MNRIPFAVFNKPFIDACDVHVPVSLQSGDISLFNDRSYSQWKIRFVYTIAYLPFTVLLEIHI